MENRRRRAAAAERRCYSRTSGGEPGAAHRARAAARALQPCLVTKGIARGPVLAPLGAALTVAGVVVRGLERFVCEPRCS